MSPQDAGEAGGHPWVGIDGGCPPWGGSDRFLGCWSWEGCGGEGGERRERVSSSLQLLRGDFWGEAAGGLEVLSFGGAWAQPAFNAERPQSRRKPLNSPGLNPPVPVLEERTLSGCACGQRRPRCQPGAGRALPKVCCCLASGSGFRAAEQSLAWSGARGGGGGGWKGGCGGD